MIRRRFSKCLAAGLTGALAATAIAAPAAQAEFGIVPGSTVGKAHETCPLRHLPESSGGPFFEREVDTACILAAPLVSQAGAHPDATGGGELQDTEHFRAKDFLVRTPPGFLGNPTVVEACSREAFHETWAEGGDPAKGCMPPSQVGVVTVRAPVIEQETYPVYRLTASPGYPDSFGFRVGGYPIVVNANLRTEEDYGLALGSTDITGLVALERVDLTIWGDPANPVHDPERWNPTQDEGRIVNGVPWIGEWEAPPGKARVPFIQTPTDCNARRLRTTATIDSWQEPGRFLPENPFDPTYAIPAPTPTGCDKLIFDPWVKLEPSIANSDSPTGVTVKMEIPLNQDPEGLATPQLKKAVVKLPVGMSVNPAAADGLEGCLPAQIGLLGTHFRYPNPIRFKAGDASCPQAAKVGHGEVETPLLEEKLEGDVYLATPYDNPFHSLLAIYLVFRGPGFVIKMPGKIEADPNTGQLTTTFDYSPQTPFKNLRLNFFGGPRAPLATSPTCGEKTVTTELTPWSYPQSGPPAMPYNRYIAKEGPAGAPCSYSLASRPFNPTLLAGTRNPVAGGTSAFELRLRRPDGNQELAGLTVKAPPGFAAYLKGIPYCSDQAIAIAKTRSGAYEAEHPDCPKASEVGHLLTGAGAGPTPLFTEGNAYLAGPYKGAPLSLATITPALAGGTPGHPVFDLGTVVVRVALYLNPETAQITAISDPIPQILEGIPLRVKDVRVILDRPNWVINPTSCDPFSVDTLATGQNGATAALSNRFQVTNCAALSFKPQLSLTLRGGTKRAAHPKFTAVVEPRPGDANIARAAVTLPHSAFLEQGHLNNICTRAQFAAKQCPAASVYGRAKAWSPLLDSPLEGPVYLRSSSHELPDLVAALKGPASQPIEVALDGRIDSVNGGIRTTFETVPDAPVSKFVLEMQGGRKGLIVNSTNLCARAQYANAKLDAQNGRRYDFQPRVVASGCGMRSRHRRAR